MDIKNDLINEIIKETKCKTFINIDTLEYKYFLLGAKWALKKTASLASFRGGFIKDGEILLMETSL